MSDALADSSSYYIGSQPLNFSLKSAVRFSSSAGDASQFFQSARSDLPASAEMTVRPKFRGNLSPRRMGCASCVSIHTSVFQVAPVWNTG